MASLNRASVVTRRQRRTGLVSLPPRVYNPRMKTRMLLVLAAVVGFRLSLPAQTVEFVVVDRQANFIQTASGSASLDGATPYEFVVDVQGQNLNAPAFVFTFKKPGDATTNYASYERDTGKEWQAPLSGTGEFASMGALHSAFPDGAYTIQTTGFSNASLSIPNLVGSTNDGFGNTPFVTATQDGVPVAWFSNRMIIDPTKSLLIQSNAFTTNYVEGNSRIGLGVSGNGFDQQVTNETVPGNFTFSGNSVQLLITGGTLSAGQIYHGDLEFNNVVSSLVDLSSIYGGSAKGVSVYTAYTNFQIQAVPEPATYAAWAALIALGAALRRRRRT